MDEDPDWSESLNIMKQENPWDVISIFDLAYFCCPECDFKHQGKQDFVSHASNNHPWVSLHGVFLGGILPGALPGVLSGVLPGFFLGFFLGSSWGSSWGSSCGSS